MKSAFYIPKPTPIEAIGIVLIASLVALFIFSIIPDKQLQPQRPTKQQIDAAVARINSQLSFSRLSSTRLLIDGEQPRNTYALISKSGTGLDTYLFEVERYTIDLNGDPLLVTTANICDLIELLQPDQLTSTIDDYRWSITLGLPPDITIEGPFRAFLDLYFALTGLGELPATRVEILIKGFADGEIGHLERDILDPPFAYHHIEVFPDIVQNHQMPSRYQRTPRILRVGNKYYNNDLPNLRAAYVKDVLILPYIDKCSHVSQSDVHILEGIPSSQPNDPDRRKVEVFINLYY